MLLQVTARKLQAMSTSRKTSPVATAFMVISQRVKISQVRNFSGFVFLAILMAISNRGHYSQPFSIKIIHRFFTGNINLLLQFKAFCTYLLHARS
jgi:hypothetical protein